MATPALATMNRGQLLALLGCERRDDGAYKLRTPCAECSADKCHIEWSKSAGIEGRIFHDNHTDDGCELSTMEAAKNVMPEQEVVVEAAPEAVVPPLKVVAEPGIDYVRFNFPVRCAGEDLQSWSRTKHGNIKLEIAYPWLVLSSKGSICRIPMTNVAYIAERAA